MHRREFLRGVAGGAVLSSVGTAAAHPGPYSPLGSVPVTNAKEAVVGPDGEVAYVAATSGFATVDIALPSDPRILAERRDLLADRETGPLRDVQDVKVDGDRLIVAGPADPLQGEALQGFALYDVSDPADPQQVAFHETDHPIHNCDLADGVAYLTGNGLDGNPLVVVDVGDDDPQEVGRWSLLDRDERWGEVPGGVRNLHDVRVRDGRAYLAHWDAGTWILDVSDPTNPTAVSRVGGPPLDELVDVPEEEVRTAVLALPGNDHFSTTDDAGDLLAINKEAWAVNGEGGPGGVELWDVSEPTSPERLATIGAPPSPDPTIGGTWTTSHNLDIAGGRLFSSWYQGGVKIHDVGDPANPRELAWWREPEETSFWTARHATPRFFVASSMGRPRNEKGGLYTFPNHPGEQKDPPPLTTAGNANSTPTTTDRAAIADETTADGRAEGATPGLGVVAGLAALLGAGAWRRLRT